MRLLNVHTLLFGEFFESKIPPYCILSHRWGENELSYKQFRKDVSLPGAGYQKIMDFCSLVRDRQIPVRRPRLPTERRKASVEWVWVDTICIDKRSSAELSEAINSMFKWYRHAEECFVFLADVTASADMDLYEISAQLHESSWFYRGWTLQELLAPEICIFVNNSWETIGHVCAVDGILLARPWISTDDGFSGGPSFCCDSSEVSTYGRPISDIVSKITSIPRPLLKLKPTSGWGDHFSGISIAQRMSWASHRYTTRKEDEAYCLLGIFEINMPLMYGEGRLAFVRLQEEIIKRSTDQSIFAWTRPAAALLSPVLALAESPEDFMDAGKIVTIPNSNTDQPTYTISNNGLQIETKAISISVDELSVLQEKPAPIYKNEELREEDDLLILLPLNCHDETNADGWKSVIALRKLNGKFCRVTFNTDVPRDKYASAIAGGYNVHKNLFSIAMHPSHLGPGLSSAVERCHEEGRWLRFVKRYLPSEPPS